MEIKKLKPNLISQIRSSCGIPGITQCVLELVYNSLDAKSNAVGVRVNLSTLRIEVIDNGEGITQENLQMVGLRYRTNKCFNLNQLEKCMKTYGYRGEALANISNLSENIEIISKHINATSTYRKTITKSKNGTVTKENKDRASYGTTIIINGFLSQQPVRKKRIRPDSDLEDLKENLEKIIIIKPNISFSLRNDLTSKIIINSPKQNSVINSIRSLYPELEDNFQLVKISKAQVTIEALFHNLLFSTKKYQFIYVNKRPVTANKLQKMICELFTKNCKVIKFETEKFAAFALNVKCPNSEIDILLDPSKTVVNFKNWNLIQNCIAKLVGTVLGKSINVQTKPNGNEDSVGYQSHCGGVSQIVGAVRGFATKRKILESNFENSGKKKKTDNSTYNKDNTNLKKCKTKTRKSCLKNPICNEKFSDCVRIEEDAVFKKPLDKDFTLNNLVLYNSEQKNNETFHSHTTSIDNEYKGKNLIMEMFLKSTQVYNSEDDFQNSQMSQNTIEDAYSEKTVMESNFTIKKNFQTKSHKLNTTMSVSVKMKSKKLKKKNVPCTESPYFVTNKHKPLQFESKCIQTSFETDKVSKCIQTTMVDNEKSICNKFYECLNDEANYTIILPSNANLLLNFNKSHLFNFKESNENFERFLENHSNVLNINVRPKRQSKKAIMFDNGNVVIQNRPFDSSFHKNLTFKSPYFENTKHKEIKNKPKMLNNSNEKYYNKTTCKSPYFIQKSKAVKKFTNENDEIKSIVHFTNFSKYSFENFRPPIFSTQLETPGGRNIFSNSCDIFPTVSPNLMNAPNSIEKHKVQSDNETDLMNESDSKRIFKSQSNGFNFNLHSENEPKMFHVSFEDTYFNSFGKNHFVLNERQTTKKSENLELFKKQKRDLKTNVESLNLFNNESKIIFSANPKINLGTFGNVQLTKMFNSFITPNLDDQNYVESSNYNQKEATKTLNPLSTMITNSFIPTNDSFTLRFETQFQETKTLPSKSVTENNLTFTIEGHQTVKKRNEHFRKTSNERYIKQKKIQKVNDTRLDKESIASGKNKTSQKVHDIHKMHFLNVDQQKQNLTFPCQSQEKQGIKRIAQSNSLESNLIFTINNNDKENLLNKDLEAEKKIKMSETPIDNIRSYQSTNENCIIESFTQSQKRNNDVSKLQAKSTGESKLIFTVNPEELLHNDLQTERNKENQFEIETQFTKMCSLDENSDWVKKTNKFGSHFYINKRTGMTTFYTPKQDFHQIEIKKRYDFMPKGLSPLLIDVKKVDTSLSPPSKEKLQNAILKSYENELISIKWQNYINDNDPKKFFEDIYREKTKLFEEDIPNVYKKNVAKYLKKVNNIIFDKDLFENVIIIGQLDFKFIIGYHKQKSLIVVFDQHAVHERIRLEKIQSDNSNKSSLLNQKMTIFISKEELNVLKKHKNYMESLGFSFEFFENGIHVSKVPLCVYNRSIKDKNIQLSKTTQIVINEIIVLVKYTKGVIPTHPKVLQDLMNLEACRGAIKFGDKLEKDQCISLIKQLVNCDLPFQCAHGRPTVKPLILINNNKPNRVLHKIRLEKLRK